MQCCLVRTGCKAPTLYGHSFCSYFFPAYYSVLPIGLCKGKNQRPHRCLRDTWASGQGSKQCRGHGVLLLCVCVCVAEQMMFLNLSRGSRTRDHGDICSVQCAVPETLPEEPHGGKSERPFRVIVRLIWFLSVRNGTLPSLLRSSEGLTGRGPASPTGNKMNAAV